MTIIEFVYVTAFVALIAFQAMCLSQFLHFVLGFEDGSWTSGRILSKLGYWIITKNDSLKLTGDETNIYSLISCIFCLNVWVNAIVFFAVTVQFVIEFPLVWQVFFFFSQIVLSHKILKI